ncbi:uncharacterized protein LOC136767931 [Amia ocellicauda]|uniref:uncharacterized protein LOC136767931 n=1 Tax=Amia ocellicauda TaxID=2972642 RepID=UPI003463DDC9
MVKVTCSTDIKKELLKKETWKCKKTITKKPNTKIASVHVDIIDTVNIIDTFDRPRNTFKKGAYAACDKYAKRGLKDEAGNRLPKAGFHAGAGLGRAGAELSVLEAEAKGPNASVSAQANVVGAGVLARAEVGSVSANAGPVGVKLGLGIDTGASIGAHGVEAKILGMGVSIGPKTSISVFNSEVSCSVM